MLKKIFSIIVVMLIFGISYALDYKELYSYLVELDGWKASEPSGQHTKTFFGEMLQVERKYTSENKSLNVQIIKGSMVMAMWMPFSMVVEQDTPDKYVKTTEIEGFKAGISHNKNENSGQIIIMVAPTAAFILKYNGIGYKDAVKIVKKFPLKKISMKLM